MNETQQTAKKTSPVVWILGALVVIILIILAFNLGHSTSVTGTGMGSPSSTTAPLSLFRTRYLTAFMKSCEKVEGFGSTTLCSCIGNHLLTSYGNTELIKISVEYKATGKIPQLVETAAGACR